jgi:hypothetical protein
VNSVERNFAGASGAYFSEPEEFVVSPIDEVRRIWQQFLEMEADPQSIEILDEFSRHEAYHEYQLVFHIQAKAVLANIAKDLDISTRPYLQAVAHRQQLELPIRAEFSPSKRLLNLWQSCVLATSREAGVDRVSMLTEREVEKEFVSIFRSLIGALGQEFRYAEGPVAALAKGGVFSLLISNELCDRFLIGPYQTVEFLSLLLDELKAALRGGFEIRGAWGRIVIDETDQISFRLTAPEFISPPAGFVRAEEIR